MSLFPKTGIERTATNQDTMHVYQCVLPAAHVNLSSHQDLNKNSPLNWIIQMPQSRKFYLDQNICKLKVDIYIFWQYAQYFEIHHQKNFKGIFYALMPILGISCFRTWKVFLLYCSCFLKQQQPCFIFFFIFELFATPFWIVRNNAINFLQRNHA